MGASGIHRGSTTHGGRKAAEGDRDATGPGTGGGRKANGQLGRIISSLSCHGEGARRTGSWPIGSDGALMVVLYLGPITGVLRCFADAGAGVVRGVGSRAGGGGWRPGLSLLMLMSLLMF